MRRLFDTPDVPTPLAEVARDIHRAATDHTVAGRDLPLDAMAAQVVRITDVFAGEHVQFTLSLKHMTTLVCHLGATLKDMRRGFLESPCAAGAILIREVEGVDKAVNDAFKIGLSSAMSSDNPAVREALLVELRAARALFAETPGRADE